MIRLLGFVLIFLVFISFIVLNLQHRSDLSFGFITFNDVPVFLSVLCSFMLGVLVAIPLAFSLSWKRRAGNKPSKKAGKPSETEATSADEHKTENNPYGID
jgi:uncharacterized integral membrane protein